VVGNENNFSKEDMAELFAKFFGDDKKKAKFDFEEGDLKKFQEQIRLSTDAIKKSTPSLTGAFKDFMAGGAETRAELNRFDEALKKTRESADSVEKTEKIKALEGQKSAYASAAASKKLAQGAVGAASAVGELASSMAQGAMDFVKSLQSGASGVEVGTQAAKNTATMGFKAAQGLAGLADGVSSVVMLMGPWGLAIGVALKVISGFVNWFSKDAQKITEQGIQAFGDELKKTQKGFKDITGAGAVMGGGMTEMRQQAARAGLDIEQLATVVKDAKEDLSGMGLGLGEATKRVAGVSKELRNSELGTQLQKLGYSFEEQAALSAAMMANDSAAGDNRVKSDKEIAAQTAAYGKDLKVLADITGQDAKKAMEKARMQAMEADLLAQAMDEGGPEAVKKLQAQLATMPEGLKKGYMEFVASGGNAITDAATNVAITQNPKIMEQYEKQRQMLQDRTKSQSDALAQSGTLSEETVAYARENNKNFKEIAYAARSGSDGIARGVTDIQNGLLLDETKRKKGATVAAENEADKMKNNMAPLDVAVTTLEANTQKLKAALGEQLTGPITGFANSLVKGMDTLDDALEKFGIVTDKQKAKKDAAKRPSAGVGIVPETGTAVTGEVDLSGGGGGETPSAPSAPASPGANSAPASPGANEKPAASGGSTKPDLANITSKSGKSAQVGKDFAPGFQKLLDYLDSVGYNIASLGGYVDRDVRGQPGKKSIHAFGGALDINPATNPMGGKLVTDMPENIGQIAKGYGLGWGGSWKSVKDAMHFSAAQSEGGSMLKAADGAMIPAHPGGTPVLAGEGGRNEAIVPLASGGKLLGMDELIEAVNKLVRVTEDHHDTSEKILQAAS
jgi:hypothetical protein